MFRGIYMGRILKGTIKLNNLPNDFKDAALFVNRFKLTKYDIKFAPPWELVFIINRGKEEKIKCVRDYIKWAGGRVL